MATHSVTWTVNAPGGQVTASKSYTATGHALVQDESIANGQTAFQINIAIDVSALVSLWIHSDQAVTIKTNSSSTPDDTLTPAAGIPIQWTNDSEYANPFASAVDVTTIFVANSSGATATLNIRALQDATP